MPRLDTGNLHRGFSPVIGESAIEKSALAVKKLNAKANQRVRAPIHRAFQRNPYRKSAGVKMKVFELQNKNRFFPG